VKKQQINNLWSQTHVIKELWRNREQEYKMASIEKNRTINQELSRLYCESSTLLIDDWKKVTKRSAPKRINEFGIIDERRYDTDNGILFICKETNDWSDKDFQNNHFFRNWMNRISKEGLPVGEHIQRHPQMWYNIGRWIRLIHHQDESIDFLSTKKDEVITEIGLIAFTNINKVRGLSSAGNSFNRLCKLESTWVVINKEIDILNPKVIICCGENICELFHCNVEGFSGKLIKMPHPGARVKTQNMLYQLKAQL
jgi:hypothetical protein